MNCNNKFSSPWWMIWNNVKMKTAANMCEYFFFIMSSNSKYFFYIRGYSFLRKKIMCSIIRNEHLSSSEASHQLNNFFFLGQEMSTFQIHFCNKIKSSYAGDCTNCSKHFEVKNWFIISFISYICWVKLKNYNFS